MDTRNSALAEQFLETNLTVIEFITACPNRFWDIIPPGEERTIGSIAFHIARSYDFQIGGIQALLEDASLPDPFDDLDGYNARMAREDFGKSKEEAIDLLQANADVMVRFISSLSEEQLEQPAPVGPNLTIRHIIESAIGAHPDFHLAEMQEFLQLLSQDSSAR